MKLIAGLHLALAVLFTYLAFQWAQYGRTDMILQDIFFVFLSLSAVIVIIVLTAKNHD